MKVKNERNKKSATTQRGRVGKRKRKIGGQSRGSHTIKKGMGSGDVRHGQMPTKGEKKKGKVRETERDYQTAYPGLMDMQKRRRQMSSP